MAALRKVMDPELHRDLVALGMVKDLVVEGDAVSLEVELTTPACPLKDTIGRDVEAALRAAGATRGGDHAAAPRSAPPPAWPSLHDPRREEHHPRRAPARAASARAPWPSTSRWRWPARARRSGSSTPTSTAPRIPLLTGVTERPDTRGRQDARPARGPRPQGHVHRLPGRPRPGRSSGAAPWSPARCSSCCAT